MCLRTSRLGSRSETINEIRCRTDGANKLPCHAVLTLSAWRGAWKVYTTAVWPGVRTSSAALLCVLAPCNHRRLPVLTPRRVRVTPLKSSSGSLLQYVAAVLTSAPAGSRSTARGSATGCLPRRGPCVEHMHSKRNFCACNHRDALPFCFTKARTKQQLAAVD